MERKSISQLVVRIGVFFVFVSFGIWELGQPGYWIGFVPPFFSHVLNVFSLVQIHGLLLLFTGGGILIGKFFKFFVSLGILIMLEIVAPLFITSGLSDVLIRDIAILIFTISLLF